MLSEPKSIDMPAFTSPEKMTFFEINSTIRVTVQDRLTLLKVNAFRSFPVTHADEYISIRDNDKCEILMIRDLNTLEKRQRKLVEKELRRRYLIPTITQIHQVKRISGMYQWKISTETGQQR